MPVLRRFVPSFVILAALAVAGHAGEHPTLLIQAADLPRLRHLCGLGVVGDEAAGRGKAGAQAAHYQALRAYFARHVPADPLPGELLGAAFLHLMEPTDDTDRLRLEMLNAALRRPAWVTLDKLEAILALDWCWADLDPGARRDFALNLRESAEGFTAADSPLDSRRFREKLAALALALVIDETDDPNPSWTRLRAHLLEAAREYFTTTFPKYLEWRGLSPTSPAVAPQEENDVALAIELGGRAVGRDLWPERGESIGRWLEHYVFAVQDHPALQHNFIRDDGAEAPLTPVPHWRGLLPLTAHLCAARTRDPAAGLMAQRVAVALEADADATPWRWVPIVLDIADVPRCDPTRLPVARNLGGAVILRGGRGMEQTAIWIDAGQPFLRRRQHFDAGHFLIRRGGCLAVDGADDVAFEAVPSKGGRQGLGRNAAPFDFEQYVTATIAHNCIVCWDAAWLAEWYGARYLPTGGQRCIDGTCTDFKKPLAEQGRLTGQQLAYGQQAGAAYLALDLTPAYDPRAVRQYSREFVFLAERVLVVIDRVALTSGRSPPTWIVNVPARPQVDGHDLEERLRLAGDTNDAGVWRCDEARWLRWTDRDGVLWLHAPLPQARRLRVVGGPAQKQRVTDGPHKGRAYVGGGPDGFERLIIPADRHNAQNAWYELGAPPLLGSTVGMMNHWGRIEIEPTGRAETTLFVNVLVTDRGDAATPPTITAEQAGDGPVISIAVGETRATLRLATGMQTGGSIELSRPQPATWTLPNTVEPDKPLE